MIDFPASPTNGQVFTSGAQSWTYDGTKWVAAGNAVMPPLASGDNRIINGDMRIDQRNNGAGGTASGYTLDRWTYSPTQTGKITWQRGIPGPTSLAIGHPYFLFLAVASAFTPAATDVFGIFQPVEADMVSDFAWGTANAQPATLSFWASSNTPGTYSGCVFNYPLPATRSYPFTFTIPVAATLTKMVIPITADAVGTWVMSGNAAALGVWFDLGSGTNFRTAPGAWVNGNYRGATGTTVSFVATAGAQMSITGVKLEIGSIATPFNRQSLAKSLADCQRYYQRFNGLTLSNYGPAGGNVYNTYTYLTQTRAQPTMAFTTAPSYNNCSALVSAGIQVSAIMMQITVTAAGAAIANFSIDLTAEL